jgi:ankyrin repeat protein
MLSRAHQRRLVRRQGATSELLASACQHGHVGIVQACLGAGIGVNAFFWDLPPLVAAAKAGHKRVIFLLLQARAQINQGSRDAACTPLMFASEQPRADVVQVLLEGRAEVNLVTTDDGMSALMAACTAGLGDVAELLLFHKADPSLQTTDNHKHALRLAAERGHVAVVQILLATLPMLVSCEVQQALLDDALVWAALEGHSQVVQHLLDVRANPSQTLDDTSESTALQAACRLGRLPVVRVLLDGLADPNQVTAGGFALLEAARENHGEVLDVLLEGGALLDLTAPCPAQAPTAAALGAGHDEQDLLQMSALMVAAMHHCPRAVHSLLRARADPNCTVEQHCALGLLLHSWPSPRGSGDATSTLTLLLRAGAHPNLRCSECPRGWECPLFPACSPRPVCAAVLRLADPQPMHLLLSSGAQLAVEDIKAASYASTSAFPLEVCPDCAALPSLDSTGRSAVELLVRAPWHPVVVSDRAVLATPLLVAFWLLCAQPVGAALPAAVAHDLVLALGQLACPDIYQCALVTAAFRELMLDELLPRLRHTLGREEYAVLQALQSVESPSLGSARWCLPAGLCRIVWAYAQPSLVHVVLDTLWDSPSPLLGSGVRSVP